MNYRIKIRKQALKNIQKAPEFIQKKFAVLIRELQISGPVLPHWPNYSPLGKTTYHCHLKYSWVACWRHEGDSIEIEVYYAGSREKAPY